jgi:hypothetical protein
MLYIANIPQTTGNVQHNICIVNFIGKNWNITKKNPESLLDASMEVGIAVNVGETKYILISCHNAQQSNNIDR